MQLLKAREVCERLRISKRTLNRIIQRGELIPIVKNGFLYFTEKQMLEYLSMEVPTEQRKVIAYYRVSTSSQKKEMEAQRKSIEDYSIANGFIVDEYLSDVGSGINFKRKNFLKLIDEIIAHKVSHVVVTYKDRLCRFAFELLEYLCSKFNVEIIVMNIQSTSTQGELIEDLMTVVHVFSSRLYGLRRYKTKIKEIADVLHDEAEDTSNQSTNSVL